MFIENQGNEVPLSGGVLLVGGLLAV